VSCIYDLKVLGSLPVHSYQSKTAKKILDTILSIQPKDSSTTSGYETRETTVYRLCDDMLGKCHIPVADKFDLF